MQTRAIGAIEVALPSLRPRSYLNWSWLGREYATRLLPRPFVSREIERQTGTRIGSPVGRYALTVMTREFQDQAERAINAGQSRVAPRLWVEPAVLAALGPFLLAHHRYLMQSIHLRRLLCHGEDLSPELDALVSDVTRALEAASERCEETFALAS